MTTDTRTIGLRVLYTVHPSLCMESSLPAELEEADSHVEEGSNTSTVIPRVAGGEEKESLEPETLKYGHESYGTRTRKQL
jgi:hypothetical protein